MNLTYITLTISLVLFSTVNAETTRFDATRDVWISAYPGEENNNMGAANKMKLKGIQEMALLDFDLSSLNGKKVESARLYFRDASEENKLRKIGISTVSSPWVEGRSRGHFADFMGHGATFLFSSYKEQNWAGEGSDLTDVIMGNGNSWQHHTELKREETGWWSVDVNPELINALITGKSYGLLIMDESGQTFTNNYVYSRESKHSVPHMMITYSNISKVKPQKLDVEMIPFFEKAHLEYGAVVLTIPIKEDIFAFDVLINDEQAPLWRIPRPGRKGTVQKMILDWLPPEKKVNIQISAVDELGQRSDPSVINGYSSRSLERIKFPDYPQDSPLVKGGVRGGLRVWALPDVTKIDPVSGQIIQEMDIEGFDRINPIWSGDKKQITLTGMRGEIIGFQLCIEAEGHEFEDISFRFTTLENKKGTAISSDSFNLFQTHYLNIKDRWYPELAIPISNGKIDMELFQKNISNRKNQSVYVELTIPSETKAGLYTGEIYIKGKDKFNETIRINLDVISMALPQKLTFVPELNMYSGPGKPGTDRFINAHRIAHEHRTVINRVPYSQDGKVHSDMIPQISYLKDGQIKIDWSDYDRRLESLFDGTAFTTGERKGIPVEKFYLPFFENWPSDLSKNYNYPNIKNKTRDTISIHALEASPIYEALTPEYKDRFLWTIREFKKHFEEKGWDQTEFQFYLNNKWKKKDSSSWWNLDEPVSYDDWIALKFFGSMFKDAVGKARSNFVFRADISRPQWQHDWLNGMLDRMYVQDKILLKYSDRVRKIKEEGEIRFSVYGSLNEIDSSNHETVMWCMRAYIEGADGVLPWQSLGGPKALSIPDRNALIVDPGDIIQDDWIVSLRVKALRRCQQNVELMAILEQKNDYKREQVRDLFYRYFDIKRSDDFSVSKDPFLVKNANTEKMENFRKGLIDTILINGSQ